MKIRLNWKSVLGVVVALAGAGLCIAKGGNLGDCLKLLGSDAGVVGAGLGIAVSGTHEASRAANTKDG